MPNLAIYLFAAAYFFIVDSCFFKALETNAGAILFSQTKNRSGQPMCAVALSLSKNLMNSLATTSGESMVTPNSAFIALICSLLKPVFVARGAKYRMLTSASSASSRESASLKPRIANLLAQ